MFVFKVKFVGAASGKIAKRNLNKITKEGFHLMGTVWHRSFRPKHFTAAGASEYGYRPRSPEYERRKQKRFGHKLPLVWTGESRTRSRVRNVKANSRRARVSMSVPKINFSGRGDELRTISRREGRALAGIMERHITKQLNELTETMTVTVR